MNVAAGYCTGNKNSRGTFNDKVQCVELLAKNFAVIYILRLFNFNFFDTYVEMQVSNQIN